MVPLKIVRLPVTALGNALTAVEPGWNGSGLYARDPAAQRLVERVLTPPFLPVPSRPLDFAITRTAMRKFGSALFGIKSMGEAFQTPSACHTTEPGS
eukprot:3594796-Prymnesium_polylepis.1